MEHGSAQDQSASTFSLADEDHTLANSLRFTLNQDPRVTFCGYSIPHPSDARVNIRVQTTGDQAREVLKDSCQDLMLMCQYVRSTFDQAVLDFKNEQALNAMKIKNMRIFFFKSPYFFKLALKLKVADDRITYPCVD